MLYKLFLKMQDEDRVYYSNAESGDTFENKFIIKLKSYGYTQITKNGGTNTIIKELAQIESIDKKIITNYWKTIKDGILKKNSVEILNNPFSKIAKAFIYQPFGSQQFPDFLMILKDKIVAIEIKFSTFKESNKKNKLDERPMWNSNLPKPNAIYLYGVQGSDVTFFKGSDLLSMESRQALLDYFDEINSNEETIKNRVLSGTNNFGFYPYIRKAYQYSKEWSTYSNEKTDKKAFKHLFESFLLYIHLSFSKVIYLIFVL